MNKYGENTFTFWLYIYGVRKDPCCVQGSVVEKGNVIGQAAQRSRASHLDYRSRSITGI